MGASSSLEMACLSQGIDSIGFYSSNPTRSNDTVKADVILVANLGGHMKEVHAVKMLLAKISPVFERSLNSQRLSSGFAPTLTSSWRPRILVPGEFEASSIEGIVRFSFGLDPRIKPKNIFNMREAALYYLIEPLYEKLTKKLSSAMRNEESFCWVLHAACKYKDHQVIMDCLDVFHSNLDHRKVFLSENFLLLNFEPDLCFLLQISELRIDEEELSAVLINWAKYQRKPSQSLGMVQLFMDQKKKGTLLLKSSKQNDGDNNSIPESYLEKRLQPLRQNEMFIF